MRGLTRLLAAGLFTPAGLAMAVACNSSTAVTEEPSIAAGSGGYAGAGGSGGGTYVKIAGCTYDNAVDLTGASAVIQQVGLSYKPACIRVNVGQTVSWVGALDKQPMKGMVGYGTQPNPIQGPYFTSPTEVTFTAPGSYGFYSLIAGAEGTQDTGMSGAIYVDP